MDSIDPSLKVTQVEICLKSVHRQSAEDDQSLPQGHGPANQEGKHGVPIAQREMPLHRPTGHRHSQRIT